MILAIFSMFFFLIFRTRVMIQGSLEYVDYGKSDGSRVQMTRIVPGIYFNIVIIRDIPSKNHYLV